MAATAHLKTQTHQPKPKRRKRREITISAAATAGPQPPVVSSDGTWCCPAAASSAPPKPAPADSPPPLSASHRRATPPPPHEEPVAMDSPAPAYAPYPASYTKFNNALNAGLLNPMSPPPPPPLLDKTRSSPTLFEMMASEHDSLLHRPSPALHPPPPAFPSAKPPISHQDHQLLLRERVADILGSCSPGNQFNDPSSSDVKLTLSSKDGFSISLNVHRQILVAHSRFFASKLSDRSWPKHQQQQQQQHQHQHQHQHRPSPPYAIEISECDDVEIYLETLRLMYCKDIRRRLMREDVSKVLGILKVSAAITFDAGVLSCLEYLEAAPWAEDEEEKVASVLSQLHLDGAGAGEVLKRVSAEAGPAPEEREAHNGNGNEEILMRLLQVVLEGKDEKARRDMKGLVSKMLRESSSHTDLTKESLYSACDGCLRALRLHLLPGGDQARIARQADNLHWLLDILIDRQMGEEFLKTWAGEEDLAQAHSQVPAIHRYEVSRVTARLLVGIGKAQVLVSKEVRGLLLRTWLEPFYEDFGWMRRACKGLDRHLVEDGLSNTILTLPLGWQQDILLGWFDRFLNSGEDCPNIQRAFEVWWRRAFWRRHSEPDQPRQLRIVSASHNSC